MLTAVSGRSGRPTHLGSSAIVGADVRDPPMRREASCPPKYKRFASLIVGYFLSQFRDAFFAGTLDGDKESQAGNHPAVLHSTRSPVPDVSAIRNPSGAR